MAAKGTEHCHLLLLYQNVLSVIDLHGLSLTMMAQTNLINLLRVNKAVRVILGTTTGTLTDPMKFMLDLPPMQASQKVEQVKAYFSAIKIFPHNLLHVEVKDTNGCRLGQAEDSILKVCQWTELNQKKRWERDPN